MRQPPLICLACLVVVGTIAGCGPETELGGTPVPNEAPDTEVTAGPPDVDETGCTVSFRWIGYDRDGYVRNFEWKLSDNGADGISVQDTLTRDPVNGRVLHPWHRITSGDTTFVVSAPRPGFVGEPAGVDRSWETHTFFLRAIDDDGIADPTPAMVHFTSTTLSPTSLVTTPQAPTNTPFQMASAVAFMYGGVDPDFDTGLPTRVRYMWKPAIMPDGEIADTNLEILANLDYFASYADSAWSPWQRFAPVASERRIDLGRLPARTQDGRQMYYVFCVQTQDTAGAVSVDRTYGHSLRHFRIAEAWPTLTVVEPNLGQVVAVGVNTVATMDVPPRLELNFSWVASAEYYVGRVQSYRYGWDVADMSDPLDPGWVTAPGDTPAHRRAPPISFQSGLHTLAIEVVDDSGQLTRLRYGLNVVPLRPPEDQYPCLLVDDVLDRNSNAWSGRYGTPYDNDRYRDAFWLDALTGTGGVRGFEPTRDILDTEAQALSFRTAAQYRALVFASRWVVRPNNYVSRAFRPTSFTVDPFNWLAAYQEYAGNVFYCSTRGMDNFLQQVTGSYAMPIVFTAQEGDANGMDSGQRVGFGVRTLPTGEVVELGQTRYPYATWGIAVVDQMTSAYPLYGSSPRIAVSDARSTSCASLKSLVLDPAFRARHLPGALAFPETIAVDTRIDWRDQTPSYYNNLLTAYGWGTDEFYDEVIAERYTPWTRTLCAEGAGGRCVEPMFRAQARFDWIRQQHLRANPNDTWPVGYYDSPMSRYCGRFGLKSGVWSAVTNGVAVGVLSNRNLDTKPSHVGDVAWGFDPYRFDNAAMAAVVRWVLVDHFGLPR